MNQATGIGGRPRLAERLMVLAGSATLMLLPILPERLGGQVPWQLSDFVFLGLLLVGLAMAYELAVRTPPRRAALAAGGLALAAGFLTMWVNLAVGIIGSEDDPANLMYFGVVALALALACVARFRPPLMALVMVATAVAQALVFIAALWWEQRFTGPITIFFMALWLLSATLYRRAGRFAAAGRT